jgi:hypothetical protein
LFGKNQKLRRSDKDQEPQSWAFKKNHKFNVQELRRLSVVTNTETCAIWLEYEKSAKESAEIRGLLHIESSWSNARNALSVSRQHKVDKLGVENKRDFLFHRAKGRSDHETKGHPRICRTTDSS